MQREDSEALINRISGPTYRSLIYILGATYDAIRSVSGMGRSRKERGGFGFAEDFPFKVPPIPVSPWIGGLRSDRRIWQWN